MEPDASPLTTCCANCTIVSSRPRSGLSAMPKAPRTGGGVSGEPGGSPDETSSVRPRSSSIPQVRVAHRLVLRQLRARPFERHPADLQHVGAARGTQRQLRVLLHDQHRQPLLLVQLAYDPEELTYDERRQP